jgi:stage III sporulation protein SpoIIIAA
VTERREVKTNVERRETTDDLDALMQALPPEICDRLRGLANRTDLLEVVMDLGRKPEARFTTGEEHLLDREITDGDIAHVIDHIGVFGDDNRAGIERTLHRISAIRNRSGKVVGLTLRIGRAVFGTIDIIRDIVEAGQSLLILGRPGVGKTTMLREVARVLADDLGKRVIVVDTSNEIAGDGDIPHPGIGDARRMQVRTPTEQHGVMIEAVENHMPEVIVIDEIGTELEASAARTIAERGVQLVGTAHGNTLDNLMLNPTLSDLVGGIQPVTLGDEEARRRGTQKTVLERKAPPTFDVLVEIVERDNVIVHRNVAETVDAILRGHMVPPEARFRDDGGELRAQTKYDYRISEPAAGNPAFAPLEPTGGFGAFGGGRGRGGGGGGRYERGRRPLPGGASRAPATAGAFGGAARGQRMLPGERISGSPAPSAGDSSEDRGVERRIGQ